MSTLSTVETHTLSPNAQDIADSYAIGAELAKRPTVRIPVVHTLHGGVYTRTVRIPAGIMVVGVTIDVPTTLIAHGDWYLRRGGEWVLFSGFHVLPGEHGRKQAVSAVTDCTITMLFPTTAVTVEEAEKEMSHEWEMLQSRDDQEDIIINTHKEASCQEHGSQGQP